MRLGNLSVYLILGLISTVYAAPSPVSKSSSSVSGGQLALNASQATPHYTVIFRPPGSTKSPQERERINAAAKALILEALKLQTAAFEFKGNPIIVDSKFYFDFKGPECGGTFCTARGKDSSNPTNNAIVLTPYKVLYQKGFPPAKFEHTYKVTYRPAGTGTFERADELAALELLDKSVLALIQKALDRQDLEKTVLDELDIRNFPPSATQGPLSFAFKGPMCGRRECTAYARDLNHPTENAVVWILDSKEKRRNLFLSGNPQG